MRLSLPWRLILMFAVCLSLSAPALAKKKESPPKSKSEQETYQSYLDYFEKVYKTMDENYYQPVSREAFNAFLDDFKTKINEQVKAEKKSDDYVRWRSASFLVKRLKSSEDIFSELYPPEPAKEYKASALGTRKDLGIEGEKVAEGFKVTKIEPRVDAYEKGLRVDDVITKMDEAVLKDLPIEKINELLSPLIDTKVKMTYLAQGKEEKQIEVVSKEYFKQQVFLKPTKIPYIYSLELQHFNEKTAEDMLHYLQYMKKIGPIMGLIIDLRGNPGGPPLAAREISSFFLPAGEEFAYFQKKGEPKAILDVPQIPEKFHYTGPMVILIDKGSGSSSELFSGVLQKRGRAILMGQNSAGQVMLKSMFPLDDGSMVLLITARGHHPDGETFSFQGLQPERLVKPEENIDLIDYASKYLYYINTKDHKAPGQK
jgi:carboxyl-terminal processing protease